MSTDGRPVLDRIFRPGDSSPVRVACDKGRFTWESRFALHYHPEVEVQFLRRGQCAYFVDGMRYELQKNSLCLIQPRQVHGFIPKRDVDIEKWGLLFPPAILSDIRPRITGLNRVPPLSLLSQGEAARVEMILLQIEAEASDRNLFWDSIARELVRELMFLVRRVSAGPAPTVAANPMMEVVVAHIEKNLSSRMSVKSIAATTGFSVRHLSRLFRSYAGTGLKHYILARRIAEARQIIERSPEVKLSAVAEAVGFENYHVFHRAFRIVAGIAPTAYGRISQRRGRK